jgi:DNA-directed RNA polymerase subunit RPC12/RpoP
MKALTDYVCASCGSEFRRYSHKINVPKYCGRACAYKEIHHTKEMDRFWNSIERIPESGCWIMHGSVVGDGYVCFTQRSRTYRAHRWSYEHFVGPIADGMVVRHRCDVPCCVNPAHLMLGTQAENIADKMSKGRQAKGSRMGAAKLTEDQVRDIRRSLAEYRPGMFTALGKEYGVDRAIIARIKAGTAWGHVA